MKKITLFAIWFGAVVLAVFLAIRAIQPPVVGTITETMKVYGPYPAPGNVLEIQLKGRNGDTVDVSGDDARRILLATLGRKGEQEVRATYETIKLERPGLPATTYNRLKTWYPADPIEMW